MPSTTRKKPSDRQQKQSRYGSSWKSPLQELELPSGERCQVRKPGIQGLIRAGVLHSVDTLTAIVQNETIPNAQGRPVTDIAAVVKDADQFDKMMALVDKIVVYTVTQPQVLNSVRPIKDEQGLDKKDENDETIVEQIPDDERLEGDDVVYTDWIDDMDKMYIMEFAVGGTADLQQFRSQAATSLGSLHPREAAAPATE